MRRTLIAIALWLTSLALVVSRSVGASDDQQYLDGLRARGLFELAEKYCADRLDDERITGARRADLTIELSRTFAGHAIDAPPSEAQGLWQQAQRVVQQFAARHPDDPKLILVRLQGALAMAVEGEAAREAIEESSDPKTLEAARDVLRTAIAEFGELSDQIGSELNRRGRTRAAQDELSTAQLQSLEANVRYELARARRNQALCYPSGTADRINALSQALEGLSKLPLQEPRTRLDWSAALEEIACLRLLGDYPQAEQKLIRLEKSRPRADVAGLLRAERIRIALGRGKIDEALSEAGTARGKNPDGPQAQMAQLEALLAAWRRAGGQRNHAEATDWQRRAVEQVRTIGRTYGSRWMRKAETLLARAMADASGPQSAELLAQAAASYYRSGQVDRALAAYDQASQRAREMRQPDQAFESAFTAATIEKERKHYRDALARYRALAAQPKEPKAAEAHLLAIHCAAQLAQAQKPPNLDEYERLLREHVATWPEGPTSSQARTWLGRLAEHRGEWQDAIMTLRGVKPAEPHYADAVEAVGRAYEAWLENLHQRGQDGRRTANEALSWLERVTPQGVGKPNAATRAAVLSAARIWLKEVPNGGLPADRLLSEALDNDPEAPDAWKTAARTLLLAALASQGKRTQADVVLKQIPRSSPPDALALLRTIWEVRRRANAEVRRNLAEVELAVEDDLLTRRGELDAATLRDVSRERAVTLAAIGRRNDALAQLRSLAGAFPKDGQTQEELAQLLSAGDATDLQAALTKWGEVAIHSRPGTPRWFRANYGLARTQLELGQVTAARATVARVTSKRSQFGGDDMKRRFERLLEELEQPPDRTQRRK